MHTTATLVWKKPDGTSVSFEVTDKPVVFGRGENADVRLDDETISRRHFVIIPRDDTFFIEDLNSTNGTWVNDQQLLDAHELRVFERVRAGHALLAFDKELALPTPQTRQTPR
jgi:pSer/pThr/pTyr-binding forkhead associated (FHA) protein